MGASRAKTVLEALAEYEYIIVELSEHTQRVYKTRVKRFAIWCQSKHVSLKAVTPALVANYLQELRSKASEATGDPLSTATLHGHMRALRTFLFLCAKPPQKHLTKEGPETV